MWGECSVHIYDRYSKNTTQNHWVPVFGIFDEIYRWILKQSGDKTSDVH